LLRSSTCHGSTTFVHQSKLLLDAHWLWRRVYWNSLTSLCTDECGLCTSGSGIRSFCVSIASIVTVFEFAAFRSVSFASFHHYCVRFLLRSILLCHLLRSIYIHSHYVYISCRNPRIPAPVTLIYHSYILLGCGRKASLMVHSLHSTGQFTRSGLS